MDRIDAENFDALAYAVGSDVYAFIDGTNLGKLIYPGSPGSTNIYCRSVGGNLICVWLEVGQFVFDFSTNCLA